MLQRKKILLLAIVGLQFAFTRSFGQMTTDSLAVDSITMDYPQCPDTAYEGQSYGNIYVLVRNLQTDSTFIGNIGIALQASDSLGVMQIDTLVYPGGISYTIGPGMATNVQVVLSYNFSAVNYRQGSNVVVVWPIVQFGSPAFIDSLHTCVNFVKLSEVNENEVENSRLRIFPNPALDYLTVNTPSKNLIEDVRIFDLTGRLVLSPLWDDSGKIKTDALSPGMYVLEISTSNKQKIRKQFIKE